jgi:hypothetical protein
MQWFVKNSDTYIEALKELLGASNPGLITRDDLKRLEERLDDLEEI